MGSPMSVISTHDQIYSNLLSSKYDLQRLYDQDISLAEDSDFWRILNSDMRFSGIVRQLFYEICASGYHFQPGGRSAASSLKARIANSCFKKSNLAEAMLGLCKGIFMARAYAYPEGRGVIASHCGTLPQEWWTVTDIKDINKQRVGLFPRKLWVNADGQIAGNQAGFQGVRDGVIDNGDGGEGQQVKDGMVVGPERDQDGGNRIFVKRYLSNPARSGQYEPMSVEYESCLIELVIQDEEERLGMGLGIAEAAYLGLRAKAIVMKSGLQGVTKWAQELLVGMIDPNRPASKRKTNLSLAQDLLTKLAAMRDGNVMVVPEGLVDIKSIASTGTGHQMVMDMLHYIDESFRECCGLAIPGGEEVKKTGSGAKLGAQKTNKAIQHHRHMLEACLNRTLIPAWCRLNSEQFSEVFAAANIVDDSEDPVLHIVDDAENDPEAMTERIEKAQKMKGIKIPLEWAHERMEIPMPSDGEAVLETVEPPMPAGFGGAGGGKPGDPNDPAAKDPGDKFSDQKKEQDHQDGEAAQKAGERANPAAAAYAARLDRLEEMLAPKMVYDAPKMPEQQIHVHAHMPELPDVEASKQREAHYKARLEEETAQHEKDRAAYEAAMSRELVVHVAAPVVENKINIEAAKAPDVHIEMKPLINVESPTVNIAAAQAPDVTVNNPARRREIMIKRNAEGKISGAEVVESKA